MSAEAGAPSLDGRRLFEAVDAERSRGELSWTTLSRSVGVSTSTIKRIGSTSSGEADGVVALCRWLGSPLEQFGSPMISTQKVASDDFARSGQMLRVDAKGLYSRLDSERERRSMTWADLADELSESCPVSPRMLTRLRAGGRVEVNQLLSLAHWLGVATSDLLVLTDG